MQLVHGPPGRSGPLTAEEIADAYPWPEAGPWLRVMMVTTLDGAATGPDGLSGSVSSAADKQVFEAVRRHADVVLVGAGTLRAERYGPVRAAPADTERRRRAGQLPAPVLAVVSGSLELPWELPIWQESSQRPLVLTTAEADPQRLAVARDHADVVPLDETSPRALRAALVERGLGRIVCEGGPRLLSELVASGLVDEADITLSPVFAGNQATPRTEVLPEVAPLRLVHVLEQDGFLMTRYVATPR